MRAITETPQEKKANLIIEEAEKRARMVQADNSENVENLERKVVRFSLSEEEYAIDAHFIHSIKDTEQDNLTVFAVPGVPNYIVGVINLRGEIISVINLKDFFALPDEKQESITKIIIVECEDVNVRVGFLVDSVHGIADFPVAEIQPALSTIEKITSDYLDGEYYQAQNSTNENSTVIGIIDIKAVLMSEIEQRLDENEQY